MLRRAYISEQFGKGRDLRTVFEQVAIPEIDLYRFLKSRLPAISLHTVEAEGTMLDATTTLTLYEGDNFLPATASIISAEAYASLRRR